jgi:protein-tyrosine-phosphatase
LLGAVAALNPGAELLTSDQRLGAGKAARPISVLFLCTGNSARSQIAEAILRELGRGRVMVRSAGSNPVGVHPRVYDALAARGIEVGRLRSKSVAQFEGHAFDYVVTLCDIARTQPMRLVGKPRLIHWSIADPARARGGQAALATAFDRVTGEIQVRVEDFYADLRARPSAA